MILYFKKSNYPEEVEVKEGSFIDCASLLEKTIKLLIETHRPFKVLEKKFDEPSSIEYKTDEGIVHNFYIK